MPCPECADVVWRVAHEVWADSRADAPRPFAPPIPATYWARAREGAEAINEAGDDLRADILLAVEDFTRRTGLSVKKLRIKTVEGAYRLHIRVTKARGKS